MVRSSVPTPLGDVRFWWLSSWFEHQVIRDLTTAGMDIRTVNSRFPMHLWLSDRTMPQGIASMPDFNDPTGEVGYRPSQNFARSLWAIADYYFSVDSDVSWERIGNEGVLRVLYYTQEGDGWLRRSKGAKQAGFEPRMLDAVVAKISKDVGREVRVSFDIVSDSRSEYLNGLISPARARGWRTSRTAMWSRVSRARREPSARARPGRSRCASASVFAWLGRSR